VSKKALELFVTFGTGGHIVENVGSRAKDKLHVTPTSQVCIDLTSERRRSRGRLDLEGKMQALQGTRLACTYTHEQAPICGKL
jgi:hypothetical protein